MSSGSAPGASAKSTSKKEASLGWALVSNGCLGCLSIVAIIAGIPIGLLLFFTLMVYLVVPAWDYIFTDWQLGERDRQRSAQVSPPRSYTPYKPTTIHQPAQTTNRTQTATNRSRVTVAKEQRPVPAKTQQGYGWVERNGYTVWRPTNNR